MPLTEVTKHHIVDFLREQTALRYHGKMDEIEFLGRIFQLDKIPSNDHRCKTFEADHHTHRIAFPDDWDDDWIFTDDRFDLIHQPDHAFLGFLCLTIHPLTRRRRTEIQRLLGAYNKFLGLDGYQLARAGVISGKPYYEAGPYSRRAAVALGQVKTLGDLLNARHLSQQLHRLEAAVEKDPELAIGTAKELVETMCRSILAERGQVIAGTPNVPTLTKMTFKELRLLPDNVDSQSRGSELIKRFLSNLGTIGSSLAELRGLYGTGHGKAVDAVPLEPRHARLAVGAASALVVFLHDSHRATPASKASPPKP